MISVNTYEKDGELLQEVLIEAKDSSLLHFEMLSIIESALEHIGDEEAVIETLHELVESADVDGTEGCVS